MADPHENAHAQHGRTPQPSKGETPHLVLNKLHEYKTSAGNFGVVFISVRLLSCILKRAVLCRTQGSRRDD